MEETADLAMEQEAFKAGEGVRKKHKIVIILYHYKQKQDLVKGYGVFLRYVDLENAEQSSKPTPTGLMG